MKHYVNRGGQFSQKHTCNVSVAFYLAFVVFFFFFIKHCVFLVFHIQHFSFVVFLVSTLFLLSFY